MRIVYLFIFFFVLAFNTSKAQSELLKAVKNENRSAILYHVRLGKDLNQQIKPEKYTPLSYAIKKDCSKSFITWLLNQDLDPDKLNNGKTPMMYAIKYDRNELIPLLLSNGAKVDKQNSAKETALVYAVKNTKIEATKILLENGANLEQIDHRRRSAMSYAKELGNTEMLGLLGLEKKFTISRDGPCVYYHNEDTINITELVPFKDSFSIKNTSMPLDSGKAIIKCTSDQGLVSHTFLVNLDLNNQPLAQVPDTLPDVVYVFSDINGNFHGLRSFLVNNKIADINLNWIAGEAHLILLGDIFALGDNVTPTLWLIYELSQKAIAANGGIHLILGNREIEVLLGNANNLNLKYRDIEELTKTDYEEQFSENTVLGSWLRNQAMIIKMDSFLFSHAGLHPKLIQESIDVKTINSVLKKTLANKKLTKKESKVSTFLIGDDGPSKFKKMAADQMDDDMVNKICSFYGVKTIIQGQKQVNRSKYLYNSKVLLTNTPKPIDSKSGKPAGIFIKKGQPFILQDNRKVIEIK